MKFTEYYKSDKLTEWLIDLIETHYKDDVALVIRCNSLMAPGYETNVFPSFYISDTEKGKELACSFIINGKSHDFFCWTYDCFEKFKNVSHYDTMVLADSVCLYARTEEDYTKYENCKKELFKNLKNSEHMKQIALSDYKWAVEIFQSCCLETSLTNVMMFGGYVCDLLVHSIASLNNRYIPQSFTNQYEFLESCKNKPEGFTELYLKINRSRNAGEIKHLCSQIIEIMKIYLNLHEKKPELNDVNGLAGWYEEIIFDWSRIRGFGSRNEPRNVRGWATKLQYAIWNAGKKHGIENYPLLEKFDETNMTEYFKYADWVEADIRKTIFENKVQLNEFATVDEFIEAYEQKRARK